MGRLTLKNLLARKFRLVLTAIAVILGVAFVAGTFVLTDTLGNVFDSLFADVNRGVDAAVQGQEAFEATPGGGPSTQSLRPPVPAALVPTVRSVDGAAGVEGSIQGYALVVKLKDGKPDEEIQGQAPTLGVSWGPSRRLNQAFGGDGRPEVGSRPDEPSEVALDEVTAEKAGVTKDEVERCDAAGRCAGARVEIVFLEHPQQRFDVVAIFKFGTVGNLAGATLAAFDTPSAQQYMNREGRFDQIRIAAAEDVSQTELARGVRVALREAGVAGIEVVTGKKLAENDADDVRENLAFFNYFLLMFALVALFVGSFIIYNTFSIIVAQRARELGLLRALGASGRQVTLSVTLEAAIVGFVSSVLGLLLGVGVALGLQAVFRATDIELPSGDLVLAPRTIIVSVLVGTLVTVLAAIAPARRAARVAPMVVLREDATSPSSGRRRYVIGAALLAGGVVGLALILAGVADPGGTAGIAVILLPVAAIFLGVAMLSSLLAIPVARAIAWLPTRLRGVTGVLARENTTRNPRRTASAAAALMVGLALMTLVAIFGASITRSLDDVLASDVKAELLLSTESFFPSSPQAAVAVREALPEADVTEFRFGLAELEGDTKGILGVDTNLDRTLNVHPERGAIRRFRNDGGLLLFEGTYDELPAAVRRSGRLPVRFAATGEQRVRIAGTFDKKEAVGNDYLLAMPTYEANFTDQATVFTAVKLPPGLSERRAERIIKRALAPFPNVKAENRAEFAEAQKEQVGQFLNLIYLLLAFAVAIALLGIANTLALSVLERTRELGLLRAVGMTRQQLRRMIRYEALIIAVFGSLLGLVLGLVFGRAILAAFESEGITFALPATVLVAFLIAGGLAGYNFGRWPARRAARMDVLRAVGAE